MSEAALCRQIQAHEACEDDLLRRCRGLRALTLKALDLVDTTSTDPVVRATSLELRQHAEAL